MNVLIQDLLAAAGPVISHALNSLPEHTRQAVIDAHDGGGWCEVRVGVQNEAASVIVVLVNVDGQIAELGRFDHLPH